MQNDNCSHLTSRILSRFSLASGSGGSPSLTPTTLGMGTGGKGLGPASFFFSSSITLLFSVWISACSSSRDFLSFSFASCSARSWSARILSRRLSSSSLWEAEKKKKKVNLSYYHYYSLFIVWVPISFHRVILTKSDTKKKKSETFGKTGVQRGFFFKLINAQL